VQNKPNFPDAQMNVTPVRTMNYEQTTINNASQNKPNQTQPVVSLSNLFITAKSKRSGDPYGWASQNPQAGDQNKPNL
jgi:hypothetical protein